MSEITTPPTELAVCGCGWYGKIEGQGAFIGSDCGPCPDCGWDYLIWLSNLQEPLRLIQADVRRLAEE